MLTTNNCNQWSKEKDILNVHLICHTHDDLGWIKTVDEYYYGARKNLVPVGVQYILNTRHNLAKLVQKGGWVQNDEATTHYVDIIDQMAFGLRKLNETFGKCGAPRVAWQIDPFGHSKEMANLFAMMDFEGLFFARLHYLEKAIRLQNNSLEFIWNASDDLKTNILTGAFYQDNYGPPEGKMHFCLKFKASHLRTNHIMLLMGSDFQYTNANEWFTNLDKLIKYVNAKVSETKVMVFYSTPACYVDALNEQHRAQQWIATMHILLSKQLDAFACLGSMDESNLDILRKANALVQHHDAITYVFSKRSSEQLTITVFNSNSHSLSTVVRIPYYSNDAVVSGPRGDHIEPQLIRTFFGTSQLESTKQAPYELLIPYLLLDSPPIFSEQSKEVTSSKYAKHKDGAGGIIQQSSAISAVNLSNGVCYVFRRIV
uniref:Glycoside hydrolase family 38 N-terminal domain-containing protein n=1 Tax=Parascaris equorum TaxID=6256 RepID=A0A914S2F3_PAREQ